MKIDLIYVEGKNPAHVGTLRSIETSEEAARNRIISITSGGGAASRSNFTVEIDEAYSHLEMEAALCVWEYLNEITLNRPVKAWVEYRNKVGSVELRHESIEIGKWALKVYELLPEWFCEGYAYDWEVIPAIVDQLQPGGDFPEVGLTAAELLESDHAKEAYFFAANEQLKASYAIDFDMTEEEFCKHWFYPERSPAETVERFAEKFNLTEKS